MMGWLQDFVVLGIVLVLARYRGDVLLAFVRAPIGIGMPLFLLSLFLLIEQMRGMMTATNGGFDADFAYNEQPWHQIGLSFGVLLLGLQGWFWTRAALNAQAGQRDDELTVVPSGEKYATRLVQLASAILGVVPVYVVGGWSFWQSRDVPWIGVGLSCLLSLGLFLAIRRRRARMVRRDLPALPDSMLKRLFLCAPQGPWAAGLLLLAAVASVVAFEGRSSFIDRNLHTTSAVVLAASCYVAIGTVWLTILRELCRVLLAAGRPAGRDIPGLAEALGLVLFVATPVIGSKVAEALSFYDVLPPRLAGSTTPGRLALVPRPACRARPDSPVIVAIAGGASRSAAWSLASIRMLDLATQGAFSRQLEGMSTVSGGSLGAMTYALALAAKPGTDATDPTFLDGLVELARADLLPSVAARLFSFDLLTGVPTRGPALSNAFEGMWRHRKGFAMNALPSFAEATAGPCAAYVLLNGVDVGTGARLLTSSARFVDQDGPSPFVDSRDVLQRTGADVGSALAVLNSARFPIVSPPGRLAFPPDDVANVIDGGTYEPSGISTAIELSNLLVAQDPTLRPILVIIANGGPHYESTPARACLTPGTADQKATKQQVDAANGAIHVPELLTSLAGLNATRTTRYLAELARARQVFCPQPGRPDDPSRLFIIDLPTPEKRDPRKTQPVPMNWVLTAADCRFMLGAALTWTPNLENAVGLATLLAGPAGTAPTTEGLKQLLATRSDPARCDPAPRSASSR